jgi:predicted small secreted protein
MDTFARRLRRAVLLLIALLAAASIVAGCAQASGIRGKLSPSGDPRTSPDSSASVAPSSPTAAPTTVQPSVTATTPATTPATTAPAVTATPTSAAPTPTVSGSPSPAPGAGTLLWLWALLGVVVIIGLVTLISQAARRRAARNRTWRAMAVDAFAKGSALHDAVYAASLPGQSSLPGQYGAGNAAARWADIQRRADDLTQTLYALREAAPTEDERARADDVLASLQALQSATQTGDMSPGGLYSSNLQTRLEYFQAALQALRGPE